MTEPKILTSEVRKAKNDLLLKAMDLESLNASLAKNGQSVTPEAFTKMVAGIQAAAQDVTKRVNELRHELDTNSTSDSSAMDPGRDDGTGEEDPEPEGKDPQAKEDLATGQEDQAV